jgi:trans-aconitate 2-methyltransferase
MARDWDAVTYDRIADPMFRWGVAVVGWLDLDGPERVLDAGCGSGRVTEVLLDRLPSGHVIALDGFPSMLDEARRRRLERFGDRVEFVLADLMEPLPIAEPVDAIISTATFHWVPDHLALYRHLAAVLRPDGRLTAQCGGAGNLASVATVLRGRSSSASPWRPTSRPSCSERSSTRCRSASGPGSCTRSRAGCRLRCSTTCDRTSGHGGSDEALTRYVGRRGE